MAISSFAEVQTQGINMRRYYEHLMERVGVYRDARSTPSTIRSPPNFLLTGRSSTVSSTPRSPRDFLLNGWSSSAIRSPRDCLLTGWVSISFSTIQKPAAFPPYRLGVNILPYHPEARKISSLSAGPSLPSEAHEISEAREISSLPAGPPLLSEADGIVFSRLPTPSTIFQCIIYLDVDIRYCAS
ncbi:hypothetical protein LTR99_007566 [Exophiala xenobiotica]|uniref:Uncharacterized protein n=1 Tax=Vermiconidia calcicola TaxID=1690605 RepID=A0AAV9Q312_9PEZI|nr:hypothetical protein LTR92_002431 [Exophiala xenobiotica]KAK5529602.1 hypothetical protein LTR23_010669 [Chaetothyriales sp. CCFEE 6169]KAK5534675.1 hypothetical protein LTR25_006707 [Vermiconidia calcicola]KAK5268840.1 hypothetical protein LTR96_005624 [Exophiala xenobiotica]KAK5299298.1 hypothetical protein LTR99_007566 [Exophiala xenobiotica]